jgi:ribosomal protein L11 methyltransferase
MAPEWVRISVETSSLASDPLSSILFELGSGGVEIAEIGEDRVRITGYLSMDDTFGERFQVIREFLDRASSFGLSPGRWTMSISIVGNTKFKDPKRFKPILVGKRLVVFRSSKARKGFEGRIAIFIKPGMAFGTGSHPTTQMCLEALEETIRGGEIVADVGTGSGILGIAALKLGASKVLAFDIDPRAIEEACWNASRNNVLSSFEAKVGTLNGGMIKRFDIVLMNITADPIKSLLPIARLALRRNGIIIMSGILGREAEEMKGFVSASGLHIIRTMTKDEWVGIVASVDSPCVLHSGGGHKGG